MYDLIIIGAGPAGITAGIYAARKKMNFLVITEDIGGQAVWSSDIQNYTGYQFISGADLVEKFREHLEQFKVNVNKNEKAEDVIKDGDHIIIRTNRGKYKTKTLIIASGRTPKEMGVKGEQEFKNRGVTYCATCDGPLFADTDVAVIGGGNSAMDAALQLTRIAGRIYLIDIADKFQADVVMAEKVKNDPKIKIFHKTRVKKIYGDKLVEGIQIEEEGIKDLPVQGVFVEIGSVPVSDFIEDIKKNKANEIIVNCRCETSIPGIFAAGDVTDVFSKQIIVACGEGAKATLAAFEYLNTRRFADE
ncbi:MAG: FAD-dependent oxidoreductase [Spirochaetes bacterium]|nr:FAD-dependent oxidoreductase [Spirochaetota bacterium]